MTKFGARRSDPTVGQDRFDRQRHDLARLRRSAEALIRSHRKCSLSGNAEDVEDMAVSLGLDVDRDFCAFNVEVGRSRAVLICIPSRNWRVPSTMAAFRRLKSIISGTSRQVLLVPEPFIRRQPRAANAQLISSTIDFDVNPSDRMSILSYLLETGSAALVDLAGLITHPDPVGAVLHLVTAGALEIDLNARIMPTSEVSLPGVVR